MVPIAPRFTCAFGGNVRTMSEIVERVGHVMASPAGRAVALGIFAVLAAFLAGYVLLGPLTLHLLPE